jgi:hypothetical protein
MDKEVTTHTDTDTHTHTHTHRYVHTYAHIRILFNLEKEMPFVITWTNMKNITLNEIRQTHLR